MDKTTQVHARFRAALMGQQFIDVESMDLTPTPPVELNEAKPFPAGTHQALFESLGGQPPVAPPGDAHGRVYAILQRCTRRDA